MSATLIENNGNGRMAYDSLILNDPKAFSVLDNKVALKIVKTLAESPASPIDVSRKLKMHEQKVYYHIRKLERSGIIYPISNEKRHGMTAKIFSVVSPVIATKLYDKGVEVKENSSNVIPNELKILLTPFLHNNTLNVKIIVGDPGPHGKFEEYGRDGIHIIDFAVLLGTLTNNINFPIYRTDVEVREADLKNNLILIGTPKTNTIIDKIIHNLPFTFDVDKWQLNTHSNINYNDSQIGIISIFSNPFEKNKKVLLLSGLSSRGIKSGVVAITKYMKDVVKNWNGNGNFVRVIRGLDKDGDGIIDDVKFLE
ncbi:MAG: helix-turn-helix transcriptional regulator [Candidatus Aenigmarchaeota archaeon]|nr:helix-turn-helix transcriptional regulator [Candidatus Aenigmarchaeota archaeon]